MKRTIVVAALAFGAAGCGLPGGGGATEPSPTTRATQEGGHSPLVAGRVPPGPVVTPTNASPTPGLAAAPRATTTPGGGMGQAHGSGSTRPARARAAAAAPAAPPPTSGPGAAGGTASGGSTGPDLSWLNQPLVVATEEASPPPHRAARPNEHSGGPGLFVTYPPQSPFVIPTCGPPYRCIDDSAEKATPVTPTPHR